MRHMHGLGSKRSHIARGRTGIETEIKASLQTVERGMQLGLCGGFLMSVVIYKCRVGFINVGGGL